MNNSATIGLIPVIVPTTDAFTPASYANMAELPRAKVGQTVPISGRYPFSVKHMITTEACLGLNKGQAELDDTFSSVVSANPGQQWFWNIGFFSIDGTTSVATNWRVSLIYHVEFYDRVEIGGSFKGLTKIDVEKYQKQERDKLPGETYTWVRQRLNENELTKKDIEGLRNLLEDFDVEAGSDDEF
jgi:hypothetical protein